MSRKVINIISQKKLIKEEVHEIEEFDTGGAKTGVYMANFVFNDNDFELLKKADTVIIGPFRLLLYNEEKQLLLELKKTENTFIGIARHLVDNTFVDNTFIVWAYESETPNALELLFYHIEF